MYFTFWLCLSFPLFRRRYIFTFVSFLPLSEMFLLSIFNTAMGGGGWVSPSRGPPVQLRRRPSTPKHFCLSAIFIEPGLSIFCVVKFICHVFFVFAFRWFRVFHRGCYVYFPIVFSSNSLYILYIFIFIYFLYIFSL